MNCPHCGKEIHELTCKETGQVGGKKKSPKKTKAAKQNAINGWKKRKGKVDGKQK